MLGDPFFREQTTWKLQGPGADLPMRSGPSSYMMGRMDAFFIVTHISYIMYCRCIVCIYIYIYYCNIISDS